MYPLTNHKSENAANATRENMNGARPMYDDVLCVRNDSLRSARHVDGITIMNAETGAYYSLSETGAFIWECLHDPTSISLVKESTAARYGVSLQDVEAHVEAFITELVAEGLVMLTNSNNNEEEQ